MGFVQWTRFAQNAAVSFRGGAAAGYVRSSAYFGRAWIGRVDRTPAGPGPARSTSRPDTEWSTIMPAAESEHQRTAGRTAFITR